MFENHEPYIAAYSFSAVMTLLLYLLTEKGKDKNMRK
jgi:hypothetical protein